MNHDPDCPFLALVTLFDDVRACARIITQPHPYRAYVKAKPVDAHKYGRKAAGISDFHDDAE